MYYVCMFIYTDLVSFDILLLGICTFVASARLEDSYSTSMVAWCLILIVHSFLNFHML